MASFDADPSNGRILLVGSDGSWALQWIEESGAIVRLAGETGRTPYEGCGFVDNGHLAVLVRGDGKLVVVDVEGGKTTTFETGAADIASAGFARDVPVVAVGTFRGNVVLFDVVRGQPLWRFEHQLDRATRERFMSWNRSGEAAAIVRLSPSADFLVLGFVDHRPLFVDRKRGTVSVAVGHEHIVWSAAIDADAGIVATGDEVRQVIVWDIASGAKLAQVLIDAPVSVLEFRAGLLAMGDRRGRTYLARLDRTDRNSVSHSATPEM